MEKPPENKIEQNTNPTEEYFNLIGTYKEDFYKLKDLQRQIPQGVTDKESAFAISEVDQKRHETHLKLIELGRKLGKDKDNVLVDIIRSEGTLEEYGLPEFSILTENDIIDTGDWHNPYDFNVDTQTLRPNTEVKTKPKSFFSEGKSVIGADEAMMVFAIVPIENWGADELNPDDYKERVRRAGALAKKVGGRLFEEWDSGYHEAYAKILGVIVQRKDLEKVATTVRNNPYEYRLGNEFYSDKAKDELLLHKANSAIEEITGVKGDLEKLPESVKGAEVLKEKTIAMIDDDEAVFESFIPHLLVETEGKTVFIPHTNQNEETLVQEILRSKADIVLLDQNLSLGAK
ncbi:MAG: hypothetical protein HYW88_03290, partial [Candidatus Sungbacteria bacterium]|nr:hypothetical protein [Candidatus Sungbacteria bacterium]